MPSAPVAPSTAPRLPQPFTPCPVCRGTTTVTGFIVEGRRLIYSVCHSCDSRWDMQGNSLISGQVIRLPNVDPLHLPCSKFEGCHSRRPGTHAGRPQGVKDHKPRKRKEEL